MDRGGGTGRVTLPDCDSTHRGRHRFLPMHANSRQVECGSGCRIKSCPQDYIFVFLEIWK